MQPAEAHAGAHHVPASGPGSKPGTSQSTRSAAGMNIVAARYILDFGYVIKGASKASKLALLAQILQRHCALHSLKQWLPARLAASGNVHCPACSTFWPSRSTLTTTAPLHSVRPPQHDCVDVAPFQLVQQTALPLLSPLSLMKCWPVELQRSSLSVLQTSGDAVKLSHHTTLH